MIFLINSSINYNHGQLFYQSYVTILRNYVFQITVFNKIGQFYANFSHETQYNPFCTKVQII